MRGSSKIICFHYQLFCCHVSVLHNCRTDGIAGTRGGSLLIHLLVLTPLTFVFLSMRSGAARGRASSNRSSYGGAGLCLAPKEPPSSETKHNGMEQGGGRSSDPAETAPPSGVEVSTTWRDLESPTGGPGDGSAPGTEGATWRRGHLVHVHGADSPSLSLLLFATSL